MAGVDDDGTYSWQGHVTVISSYVRDPRSLGTLVTHSLGPKHDANAIGLQALLHRQGFRPDGSKQFDVKVPKTPEEWRRRLPTLKTVKKDILGGGTHFEFTEGVSIPLLQELRATISRLKTRGVFLIGYSPPVIAEWANVAATAPRQKDFWEQYHKNVPELFRSLDIPYFDIITPEQLGLDDHYMRDAYHAYDTFNLHVLQHFCDDPRVRAAEPVANRFRRSTKPLARSPTSSSAPPRSWRRVPTATTPAAPAMS